MEWNLDSPSLTFVVTEPVCILPGPMQFGSLLDDNESSCCDRNESNFVKSKESQFENSFLRKDRDIVDSGVDYFESIDEITELLGGREKQRNAGNAMVKDLIRRAMLVKTEDLENQEDSLIVHSQNTASKFFTCANENETIVDETSQFVFQPTQHPKLDLFYHLHVVAILNNSSFIAICPFSKVSAEGKSPLDAMENWISKMENKSGLIDAIIFSKEFIRSIQKVEVKAADAIVELLDDAYICIPTAFYQRKLDSFFESCSSMLQPFAAGPCYFHIPSFTFVDEVRNSGTNRENLKCFSSNLMAFDQNDVATEVRFKT